MNITISITDDHPIVRDGLQRLVEMQPHLSLLGMYANANQVMAGLKIRQPDVLLLDLHLPDKSGEEIVPLIRKDYPDIKIIMLTANDNIHSIKMMMNKGARGYLLKTSDQALLVQAIEEVYNGNIYISPEIQQKLNQAVLQSKMDASVNSELTNRELDVLRLIAEEKSSKEIGEILHIGYRTVENYRQLVMQKLGAKNMVGMVKKAILLGILKD